MTKATNQLVDYAATLRYENLPPEAVKAIKTHILDTLGAIIAGSAAEGM